MKMVALARLACPEANIPATTALSTLDPSSRIACLARGANVVMPNLTPAATRVKYDVYPGKGACEPADAGMVARLASSLAAIGRSIGAGPGSRVRQGARAPAASVIYTWS